MVGKKIYGLTILLAFAFLMQSVSAVGVVEMEVKILNAKPHAYDLYATPVVLSNTSSVVWCKGFFWDNNAFADLKSFKGAIIPTMGGPRKESIIISSEKLEIAKGEAVAGFVIESTSPAGAWECILEGTDNAGDTAENKTIFKVMPVHCGNNAKDGDEENSDCGGSCVPCTCKNGAKDQGEDGTDCGGPCGMCKDKGSITVNAPKEAVAGEGPIEITVTSNGQPIKSIVRIHKSRGIKVIKYDGEKPISLDVDSAGTWVINADQYGYQTGEARVVVIEKAFPIVMIAVPVVLILIIVIILVLKKKGGGGPPATPEQPSTQQWEGLSDTPTEQATTEPAPTEPAPTEPAPTEPAPTEPAPTEDYSAGGTEEYSTTTEEPSAVEDDSTSDTAPDYGSQEGTEEQPPQF